MPNLDLVQIAKLWNVVHGEYIKLIATELGIVCLGFVQAKFRRLSFITKQHHRHVRLRTSILYVTSVNCDAIRSR